VSQAIRAIYTDGQLHLLDPVELSEGQQVQLVILSDRERILAALGDLLAHIPNSTDDDVDETTLLNEIEADLRGKPTISDAIIQESREGS
jgi:predicted DNA-binding antitoxin AbrB/MazE fold protein